ncbi:hypothetical protein M514_10786 [Trichuris suis]|uniref:FLYWCH-type domain-containing protein n=1 Tax=Trichuris suis TaxID=68888 RepID=A0A085N4Q9_9BILA|nr:hypothetical protein M514_10786 [Trichuris suis]
MLRGASEARAWALCTSSEVLQTQEQGRGRNEVLQVRYFKHRHVWVSAIIRWEKHLWKVINTRAECTEGFWCSELLTASLRRLTYKIRDTNISTSHSRSSMAGAEVGTQRVSSNRNHEKRAHNGYLYCFDKMNAAGTANFWRCDRRYMEHCKARLHTTAATGVVIKEVNRHCHGGEADRINVTIVRGEAKRRAEETMETPAMILNEVYGGASVSTMGQMPAEDAMKKMIRRRRTTTEDAPPQPVNREAIIIPLRYTTYPEGERFLLYDSGVGDVERILILGRQWNATWSSEMKTVFADGTLNIASPLFAQVYVLLASKRGFIVPVLYALLPDKRESTYCRIFHAVKATWPQFSPETISMDFERAAMNAASSVFPSAEICGCFFHLMRNMKKQLSLLGLSGWYKNDGNFALAARMIIAMAFVPLEDLDAVFRQLARQTPRELWPVLDWFEQNYMGRLNSFGGCQRPSFPPNMWSTYQRTLQGRDRTNNFAEAAHRRLRSELSVDHPTIWKFIDGLRSVQAGRDQHFECFVRGDEPPRKRLKYVRADQRIQEAVQRFTVDSGVLYLRGLAHNFAMN